jgi:quinol monooxygenase YgiN
MGVTVIWEAQFNPENAARGEDAMKRIWEDMRGFKGYLNHEFLTEIDDPAHVIVVSHWESREAADRVREEYRSHPNAVAADHLAAEPRRRVVAISR